MYEARVEAGFLLRRLQQGETLSPPYSRPMPTIGAQCHELRVNDRDQTSRIIYHIHPDAIVILNVFSKTTATTPPAVIESCRKRLAAFKRLTQSEG